MIGGRRQAEVDALVAAVLNGHGRTPADLRRAVTARAAALAAGSADRAALKLPTDVAGLVDTAALHAYRVTDQDLQALKSAGYTDDQLFEIAIAVAVGAALGRLEIGLKALRGSQP